MRGQCHGLRQPFTMQSNLRPVRRIDLYYKSLYGVNPLVNPKSQPHLKNGVKLVSALCVRTRKVATCDSSALAYHNEVMAC